MLAIGIFENITLASEVSDDYLLLQDCHSFDAKNNFAPQETSLSFLVLMITFQLQFFIAS